MNKDQFFLIEKKIHCTLNIYLHKSQHLSDIVEQDLSIVFASPEAATQQRWRKILKENLIEKICLLVFDEAHCISSW